MTLRQRMLLVLALAGLPGIVIAVVLTVQKFAEQSSQIETSVMRLGELGATHHQAIIANARTLLKAVASGQRLESIGDAECDRFLSGQSDSLPFFNSLTLFDIDGEVVCTSIEGELPYSVDDQDWFKTTREGKDFALSDYTLGRTGEPLLVAASPATSPDGSVIAVAALGISLNWLDFITGRVELPPEATITALGPEGQILSHRGAGDGEPGPPPSEFALQRIRTASEGALRAKDSSESTRIYGFEKTDVGGVLVIVGLPQFVEYSEWGAALLDTLLVPLSILFLALAAAAWASDAFVTRHVRSLVETTEEIAGGDLSARSRVDYDEHEIGELAAAVDEMAEEIETSHRALETRLSDSETIADEMRHRFGNSLAVVQSIARQTSQHSRSPDAFYTEFSARLQALATSNQMLAQYGWRGTRLKELLESVLAPHTSPERQVFDLQGPDVEVNSRASMALAMTAHELATNAVKYGALSQPGGTVTIRWWLGNDEPAPSLYLEWREAGGPEPSEPRSAGFGSKLMASLIESNLGGNVSRAFEPGGLVCRLNIPLGKTSDGR